MPALTVDTNSVGSSSPASGNGTSQFTPQASATPQEEVTPPPRPTYSPVSPTTRTSALDDRGGSQPVKFYKHEQADATFIAPPVAPVETVDMDTNPDALALKANCSVLQMQERKLLADITMLERMRNAGKKDPRGFVRAMENGTIRTEEGLNGVLPRLAHALRTAHEDSRTAKGHAEEVKKEERIEDEQNTRINHADMDTVDDTNMLDASTSSYTNGDVDTSAFEGMAFPRPLKISKTPIINWAQYGVVGPSFDKLHEDLYTNPPASQPAQLGPDGQVLGGYVNAEMEPLLSTASSSPVKTDASAPPAGKNVGGRQTAGAKTAGKGGKGKAGTRR